MVDVLMVTVKTVSGLCALMVKAAHGLHDCREKCAGSRREKCIVKKQNK